MRVLLIEDDAMIGKGLVQALSDHGMSVDWARTGLDGDAALATTEYAMILLDLGLPEKSGIDVLRSLRRAGNKTPLLILSARDTLDDRVLGLDLGADDYLVKPFEMRELLSRMRVLQRRQAGHALSTLGNGALTLDLANHHMTFHDISVVLPAREFALMQALAEQPGRIFSRSQLEERIYGWGDEVESNAVEVLIHSIRKKFDKTIIRNLRGAGWMIDKGEG